MSCIIENCKLTYANTTLFGIPVAEDARKKWVESIRQHQRFDDSEKGIHLVCLNHFHPQDIDSRGTQKKLSPLAVPQIFPKKGEKLPVNTSQPNVQSNLLKRSNPSPTGPPTITKIQKLDQSLLKNVPTDPNTNNVVGKKVRLSVASLKSLSTVVNAKPIVNANTNTNTSVNVLNKSTGHIQQLTVPIGLNLGAMLQKKLVQIVTPKKNVNPIPGGSLGVVPKIEEVDPLQSNAAHGTGDEAGGTLAKEDNFEEQNLSEPNQLKIIDIDKLKEAPILVRTENTAAASKTIALRKDPPYSIDPAVEKVVFLENTIKQLRRENTKLKRTLQANRAASKEPTQPKTFRKQCVYCKEWISPEKFDLHLCVDKDYVTCNICNSWHNTTRDFIKHINSHTVKNVIPYKCDKCKVIYWNETVLEFHRKSHAYRPKCKDTAPLTTENTHFYKCAKCEASFQKANDLAAHMRQVHSLLNNHKCYYCGAKFPESVQLEVHIRDAHKNIYECKTCNPMLAYMEHYHSAHEAHDKAMAEAQAKNSVDESQASIDYPEIPKFSCFSCKIKIKSLSEFKAHMKQHVKDQVCEICKVQVSFNELKESHVCGTETSISCEYCNETFTSTAKLLEHLETPHESKKLYGCSKCFKYFPQLNLRQFHMAQHENEEGVTPAVQHICEECGKGFDTVDKLNKHQKYHKDMMERTRDHLCDECGASFISETNLQNHKRSSIHSEPTIECPDCPRKFYDQVHFKRHAQKHLNVTFVCDICQRELRSANSYKKHIRVHNRTAADKRFECAICHIKFYDSKGLKKHSIVHTEHRAHSCQYCDVSYKYKGDLNKHLRLHIEDGKIHQCTICDSRFYYVEELEQHSIDHYKEDKAKRAEADAQAAETSTTMVEIKLEEGQVQEQQNGKSVKEIVNNAMSPSVLLQPAFVHDNLQLWN